MAFQVFISFKNLDNQQNQTIDSRMAEDLYHALIARGINTFFSNISLRKLAASDFQDAIYEALDQCSILVAVGSKKEHFESRWIKREVRTFDQAYLNGNKCEANYGIVTYVTPDLKTAQRTFIHPLRDMQSFCELDDVVEYVENRLNNADELLRRFSENAKDDIHYDTQFLANYTFESYRKEYNQPVEKVVLPPTCIPGVTSVAPVSIPSDPFISDGSTTTLLDDSAEHQSEASENHDTFEVGSVVFGRYRIAHVIGHGGMSTVYLVINEKSDAVWAMKVIRKDRAMDFGPVRRLYHSEINIMKMLNHPMSPRIIDVYESDWDICIIMDYVDGLTLQSVLDTVGAQQESDVLGWAIQMTEFLEYIHSLNLVHRDIKPANIMLRHDGRLAVLDFGTTRKYKPEGKYQDTTCLGTRGYAAPEQYGGRGQTDARTDIYSLGTTMYTLLTGHNPAEPPYDIKPIRSINPGLSQGMEHIIERCTNPDPEMRYQNAAELRTALEQIDQLSARLRRKAFVRKIFPFT